MSTSKMVLHILNICIGILLFILVVLGLIKLGNASYTMGYRVFMEQPMTSEPGKDVVVEVTEGMSAFSRGKRAGRQCLSVYNPDAVICLCKKGETGSIYFKYFPDSQRDVDYNVCRPGIGE